MMTMLRDLVRQWRIARDEHNEAAGELEVDDEEHALHRVEADCYDLCARELENMITRLEGIQGGRDVLGKTDDRD